MMTKWWMVEKACNTDHTYCIATCRLMYEILHKLRPRPYQSRMSTKFNTVFLIRLIAITRFTLGVIDRKVILVNIR